MSSINGPTEAQIKYCSDSTNNGFDRSHLLYLRDEIMQELEEFSSSGLKGKLKPRATTEIFSDVQHIINNGGFQDEMKLVLQKIQRLAIYLYATGNELDQDAKDLAIKSIKLPENMQYLRDGEEEDKDMAFSSDIVEKIQQSSYEKAMLKSATSKSYGEFRPRGNRRRSFNRGSRRGHFFSSRGRGRGSTLRQQTTTITQIPPISEIENNSNRSNQQITTSGSFGNPKTTENRKQQKQTKDGQQQSLNDSHRRNYTRGTSSTVFREPEENYNPSLALVRYQPRVSDSISVQSNSLEEQEQDPIVNQSLESKLIEVSPDQDYRFLENRLERYLSSCPYSSPVEETLVLRAQRYRLPVLFLSVRDEFLPTCICKADSVCPRISSPEKYPNGQLFGRHVHFEQDKGRVSIKCRASNATSSRPWIRYQFPEKQSGTGTCPKFSGVHFQHIQDKNQRTQVEDALSFLSDKATTDLIQKQDMSMNCRAYWEDDSHANSNWRCFTTPEILAERPGTKSLSKPIQLSRSMLYFVTCIRRSRLGEANSHQKNGLPLRGQHVYLPPASDSRWGVALSQIQTAEFWSTIEREDSIHVSNQRNYRSLKTKEAPKAIFQNAGDQLVTTESRRLCLNREKTDQGGLELSTRPGSSSDRCFSTRLVPKGSVSSPFVAIDPQGDTQSAEGQGLQGHPSHPKLAQLVLVANGSEHGQVVIPIKARSVKEVDLDSLAIITQVLMNSMMGYGSNGHRDATLKSTTKHSVLSGIIIISRAPKEITPKKAKLGVIENTDICPVKTLFEFVTRSRTLRCNLPEDHALFLGNIDDESTCRSIRPSSAATWLTTLIKASVVDKNVFTARSLSSAASTTKAVQRGATI
ncbi:hypothetical protein [Parasitella parasitica]|uniref:Uncharacterized protein n=1 Tax=Parasitella parasitica TaxID=35722 RepID=A0A0B7NWX5_9FUNG|nr:hypothetical protein [Parasitella parasitica]